MLSAHFRPPISPIPQRSPWPPCLPITQGIRAFPFWQPKAAAVRGLQARGSRVDFFRKLVVMAGSRAPAMDAEIERFAAAGNEMADAAGEVIRKYFRQGFTILDKDDLSPVTIADREAEEAMSSIIMENFPTHAIFGEENGWRCKNISSDYIWVLDPIDGTKSFITGKPLFGTLIALLYKGKPIVGIIDQPILRERWIGIEGTISTLNGREISTRPCGKLSQAYLYTTSPHFFTGATDMAFNRLRKRVKVPLYGCDCYAFALLASGFVDLVVEAGLKELGDL